MKSVGEAMLLVEHLKSPSKSTMFTRDGLIGFDPISEGDLPLIKKEIRRPNSERVRYVMQGMREGLSNEDIFDLSKIDPWFLDQLRQIHDLEVLIKNSNILEDEELLRKAKTYGFSDAMIALLEKVKLKYMKLEKH